MITEVGDKVISYLEPFRVGGSGANQFIDKLAGVVTVLSKQDKDAENKTIVKRFPVACGMSYDECINTGSYQDLVPNDQLGCITYLEEQPAILLGEQGGKQAWKCRYDLIAWMNKKKLGKASQCSVSSQIITTYIGAFPKFPINNGIYQKLLVKVVGQSPKNINPFLKYSYDEEVNQFLMAPFDYFSLPIEVTFEIDERCFTPFEKDTENVC